MSQVAEHAEVPVTEMAYEDAVHFDWIARTFASLIGVDLDKEDEA